jgi:hypothetical protein
LNFGECAEVDRPAALILQDATTTGTSSGYYQLFEATDLSIVQKTGAQSLKGRNAPNKSWKSTHPVQIMTLPIQPTVACINLTPPTKDYYRVCNVPLKSVFKNQIGVRLCTGNNFVTRTDNTAINYPASLLELTTTDF